MNSIAVIINMGSGFAENQDSVTKLRTIFSTCGVQAEFFLVNKGSSVLERTQTAIEQGYECIVAAGGDGTINAVATQLVGTKKILGVIPTGTFNHFAQDVGIPSDLQQAVMLLKSFHHKRVDVGVVNEKIFLNNSSIGWYPTLVKNRERLKARGVSKYLHFVVTVCKMWYKFSTIPVTLAWKQARVTREVPFLFIGNNCYNTEGGAFGKRSSLTKGNLCLYVPRFTGKGHMIKSLFLTWKNKNLPKNTFSSHETPALEISSPKKYLHVSIDGEIISLATPLMYSIKPKSLRVLVP